MAEVLPEALPQDTVSRYCPICKRPVTGLKGRKVFFIVSGLFVIGVLLAIAILFFFVFNSINNLAIP
ncbi:MAG: hypothetical protein ABL921_08770 [Pirellula sp.]